MGQPKLRVLLDRTSTVLLIGLLTALAALPIVTLPAAFAAATVALAPGEEATVRTWWTALRVRPGRALTVGVLMLAAEFVGLTDAVFFLAARGEGLGLLVGAVGLAIGTILLLISPATFAELSVPTGTTAQVLRRAAAAAAAAPATTVAVSVLHLLLLVTAAVLPVLLPATCGLAALASSRAHRAAINRLRTRAVALHPVATT